MSEGPSLGGVPAPYPLAMVVCDAIHADPGTGKMTILGTFSAIFAPSFPAVHPQISVYLSVTDGRGTVPLNLRLVDANEEREPVFSVEAPIPFADPLSVVELRFLFQGVVFPEPGEYRIQVFAGAEHLIERRLAVIPTPRPPGEQAHD